MQLCRALAPPGTCSGPGTEQWGCRGGAASEQESERWFICSHECVCARKAELCRSTGLWLPTGRSLEQGLASGQQSSAGPGLLRTGR